MIRLIFILIVVAAVVLLIRRFIQSRQVIYLEPSSSVSDRQQKKMEKDKTVIDVEAVEEDKDSPQGYETHHS